MTGSIIKYRKKIVNVLPKFSTMTTILLKKLLIMSKYALFCLIGHAFLSSLVIAGDVRGQDSIEKIFVSIAVDDSNVEETLVKIENLTGFNFTYRKGDLPKDKKLTIKSSYISLANLLRRVSRETNLKFKRVNEIIHITKHIGIGELVTEPHWEVNEEIDVSGKVTESNGAPLPGVNILVKGTQIGAITDVKGVYNLSVPDNLAVLVFSSIGFVTQEIEVGNQTNIDVTLQEDVSSLSEIVVIGYGTKQKREITGAISSIASDAIEKQSVTGFDQALSGRIAGVQVLQSSGAPGGSVSVRVRGVGSPGVSDPLYVIDGIPVFNSNAGREFIGRGQPTNVLNTINPNDILSIEVLKDAASAAIYGSRAANGVVIITTKRGEAGKPKFSIDYSFGTQSKEKDFDLLDGPTYDAYVHELLALNSNTEDDGPFTNPANTNWPEEIFRSAPMHNLNISTSGGNQNSTYLLSLGYFSQEGILRGTDFERFSLRFNSTRKFGDKLTIGNNATVSRTLSTRTAENNIFNAAIPLSVIFPPVIPARLADGSYGGPGDVGTSFQRVNPLVLTDENLNESDKFRFLGNVFFEYELFEGLTYRLNLGADFLYGGSNSFTPAISANGTIDQTTSGTRFDSNEFIWLVENTLAYNKTFNKDHKFEFLVGVTQQKSKFSSHRSSKADFPVNDLIGLNAGNTITAVDGNLVDWSLASFIGRVNYNYKQKYFLTGSIRRDGSSRFGTGNKWGTFPSVSAGWLVSEEPFFNIGAISELKVRASWGQLGNQEISPFQYLPLLANNAQYAFGGANVPGLYSAQAANQNITWETSTQTDIGLDVSLFDHKLTLSIDYYNKETEDILLQSTLPLSYGFISDRVPQFPFINAGVVRNKGLEFEIGYRYVKDDFEWSVDANFATLDNEVLSLGNGGPLIQNNEALSTRTDVGSSIGAFYGYVIDGVFQTQEEINALNGSGTYQSPGTAPGDFKFRDLDNNGVIDQNDQTYIGSPIPDLTYGISFNASYKNFDFLLALQGTEGNDIFASILQQAGDFTKPDNKFRSLYENRWRGPGSSNSVPRVAVDNANDNYRNSDYFIQDGSYLRLKSLQIGYRFPSALLEKWKISNMRIYVGGQNLLTFDKYEYGLDPEVGAVNENNTINGVDFGRYPIPRTFTVGLNFTL